MSFFGCGSLRYFDHTQCFKDFPPSEKYHEPPLPGRPIISGCNSPTANLSTYIDFYLKPIVKQLPSNIQDTTHFLRTLWSFDGTIPQNSILVTFDVKSLYTNIPHDEGITCCSIALQTFYGQSLPLPLKYTLQLITFILKKNYFKFKDTFYLQTHGTAMGSPFAPNYASIFMDHIERQILHSAPDNKTPILWLRFIDDIFAIWTYSHDCLHQFFEHSFLLKNRKYIDSNEVFWRSVLSFINIHDIIVQN